MTIKAALAMLAAVFPAWLLAGSAASDAHRSLGNGDRVRRIPFPTLLREKGASALSVVLGDGLPHTCPSPAQLDSYVVAVNTWLMPVKRLALKAGEATMRDDGALKDFVYFLDRDGAGKTIAKGASFEDFKELLMKDFFKKQPPVRVRYLDGSPWTPGDWAGPLERMKPHEFFNFIHRRRLNNKEITFDGGSGEAPLYFFKNVNAEELAAFKKSTPEEFEGISWPLFKDVLSNFVTSSELDIDGVDRRSLELFSVCADRGRDALAKPPPAAPRSPASAP